MKTIRLSRKRLMVVAIVLCGMALLGLTIVQARTSSISLDSPVSFPVDI
ncbi:MAG TPA: hypothetical protein VIU36_05675 [Gammaproteobacteria bacterium]